MPGRGARWQNNYTNSAKALWAGDNKVFPMKEQQEQQILSSHIAAHLEEEKIEEMKEVWPIITFIKIKVNVQLQTNKKKIGIL